MTDPRLSRVDHVGSLLRPRELLDARRGRDRGELDAAAFKAVEDDAVRHVVRLQEACGCRVVTDGEQRRDSFQSELTAAVDGFAGVSMDAWLWGDWHSAEVGDLSTPRAPQADDDHRDRRRRLAGLKARHACLRPLRPKERQQLARRSPNRRHNL